MYLLMLSDSTKQFSLVNKVQFNPRLSVLCEVGFKTLLFSLRKGCSPQIKRKVDYIKPSSNSVSILPLWCLYSQFRLISVFILEVTLPGSHDVFSTWTEYGAWCQECSARGRKKKGKKRGKKKKRRSEKTEYKTTEKTSKQMNQNTLGFKNEQPQWGSTAI